MTNQEKIYEWCDRCQAEFNFTYGFLLCKSNDNWVAIAQKFDQHWRRLETACEATPEEAIAKLAEALGL